MLLRFLVDLPPQTKPKIIKKTTFCNFGRRSFSRLYFGGILDDRCILKPSKTIIKTMVLKLFRFLDIFRKVTQNRPQMKSEIIKTYKKTPFRNHVVFPPLFVRFLLDLGSILGFILTPFWTYVAPTN